MLKDAILQGLNDTQRTAVLHGEGPALVAAGPGSGKTRCITSRLLYLIFEKNIPPQEILVLTFTKEAAKTMQKRFEQEYHRLKDTYNIHLQGFASFGTFHSFFYQILRSISKYSEYQLITHQEKHKIVKEILKGNSSEEVTETEIQHFLMCVSFYKNTGQVKLTSSQAVGTKVQEKTQRFLKQFDAYESEKRSYKRLDFDDMLYLCREELEQSKDLLEYWQKRYSYILVDEAQDMNAMQYNLLKLLTIAPYNLFMVGDDDQTIYSFRGSDTKIFPKFMKDYPQCARICLNQNYRCCEAVVKASNRLIERNKHRVTKELVVGTQNALKGKISTFGCMSTKESYNKVIDTLKTYSEEEQSKQAILFRTNFAMQTFAVKLITNNMPYVLRENGKSLYEHFIVKDILDYFQAAAGNRQRALFLSIFQKLSIPLGREALRSEGVNLAEVKQVYETGFYENKRAYEAVEALERHLNRLGKMRPALGIKYILHALEYEKYLLRKCEHTKEIPQEWQQMIEWLTEDAEDFIDYKSWREHIEKCFKEWKVCEKKGVHLLTMHAAKGLEFKKVYIMNLNEGMIPQLRRGETLTQERLEEERRLFYVGMTRAKEELELHYVTGTKENPRIRSRFLEELV